MAVVPDFVLDKAFEAVYVGVEDLIIKNFIFRSLFNDVKSSLDDLAPLIKEMAQYNQKMDRPERELEALKEVLEKGQELIDKCSTIKQWSPFKKYKYGRKLLQWQESLKTLVILNSLKVPDLVQIMKIEAAVDDIHRMILKQQPAESTDSPAYEEYELGDTTEDYYGSISSAGDTDYNESSQIATPSAYSSSNGSVPLSMHSPYSSSNGFVALSIGGDSDREYTHSRTKITALDWFLFFTGISMETLSVVFDLRSSPQKPRYALAGMSCAIVAVLVCSVELICKVITERVLLASQNNILSVFMVLLFEIAGFGLAIIQSISSIAQFYYYSRHEDNGLKVYLVGIYFSLCLFLIKLRRN